MHASASRLNKPQSLNVKKSVRFRLPEVEVVVPVRESKEHPKQEQWEDIAIGNLKVAINSKEDGATTPLNVILNSSKALQPPTTSEDKANHQPDCRYYTSSDLLAETAEEMASRLHPLQQARYYSLKRIAELTASCRSQEATDTTPKISNKISKRIRQPKKATDPNECRRSERVRKQIAAPIQPNSDANEEELANFRMPLGSVVKSSITGLLIHNEVVHASDKMGCISAWNIWNGCSLLKQTRYEIHSLATSSSSDIVGLYTEPSKPSGGLFLIDAQDLKCNSRPLDLNPTAMFVDRTNVWTGTADGRAVFVDLRSQGGFISELTLQSSEGNSVQSIGKIGDVLAFSFGSKIALVDSRTNKSIDVFGWESGPGILCFHSSRQCGLMTGEGGNIGVWADINVGEKWKPPTCFKHNVKRHARAVWHPQLPIFYIPSTRKTVDILSPNGRHLGYIENGTVPTRLAISSDGLYLGLSTTRGTVAIWNADA